MERLKKCIFDNVEEVNYTKDDCVNVMEYTHLVCGDVWDDAINTALKENKKVYIPDMGKEIFIASSIVLEDD